MGGKGKFGIKAVMSHSSESLSSSPATFRMMYHLPIRILQSRFGSKDKLTMYYEKIDKMGKLTRNCLQVASEEVLRSRKALKDIRSGANCIFCTTFSNDASYKMSKS